MYSWIQKNTWLKVLTILVLGILMKILTDISFGLVYRNYEVFRGWENYLFSIVLTSWVISWITLANRRLDQRFSWQARPRQRFFLQAITNIAIALFIVGVVRLFMQILIFRVGFISLTSELIIYGTIAAVTFSLVMVDLGVVLLEKWRFSLAELERFKKENVEFHFQMLKTQVNPHFLFNSLNTLSSLIFTDQEVAAKFVRQLSLVYRYVLQNRDKTVISLKEELEVIRAYIYLLELRFSNNLSFKIDIEDRLLDHYIAPMTLQMLIENAIKHNIISTKKPLKIELYTNGADQVIVSNNLQKKDLEEYSSEIGLKNIDSRYGFITDRKVEVIQEDGLFTVKIPLIASEDEGIDH